MPCHALAAHERTVAQTASLLRLAGGVDDAVDVYRLALLELVPTLRKLGDLAAQPGTEPTTGLPPETATILARLSGAVNGRVSASALPAITRAYHVEAADALAHLAGARTLQQTVAPSRALLRAVEHIASAADDVIDLYTRERPGAETVLSPDDALDGIRAALDELELAEANVHRLQLHGRKQGDPLQAFMRLDIALGHALDMIAAARQSGMPIGIELPQSQGMMQDHVAALRHHIDGLHQVVEAMQERPRFSAGEVRAAWSARPDGGADVQLQWVPPPTGDHTVAALRIYRRALPEPLSDAELQEAQCDAGRILATQKAKALAKVGLADSVLVAQLPPGRAVWNDQLPAPALAPTAYRLAAVSAFGVERLNNEELALAVPAHLVAPTWVSATTRPAPPDSPSFYHDAGAVQVTWAASASDVLKKPRALQYAADHNLPVARRYEIWRDAHGAVSRVGRVGPNVTQFLDRPPLADLKSGVRYTVDVVDIHKTTARASGVCAPTPALTEDLTGAFAQARAGAQFMARPNAWERRLIHDLADPNALALARSAFESRFKPAAQADLLAQFWNKASLPQKITWYKGWVAHLGDTEREAFLADPNIVLAARDVDWVVADVFVHDHPELTPEVLRWWKLLDEKSRDAQMHAWRRQRDQAHLNYVASGAVTSDANVPGSDWPLRLFAWWQMRDAAEKERIRSAWDELTPQAQQQRLVAFVAALPPPVAQSLRWPDWEQLNPAEQADFLQDGVRHLPQALWPHALAWIGWETLDDQARLVAIRDNVGPLYRAVSFARYSLRPLDVYLDFKLTLAFLVLALGVLSLIVVQYAGQKGEDH